MTEISKKDLAELLAILSEADTDLIRFLRLKLLSTFTLSLSLSSLEKKLMALEEAVKHCRERELGGFDKDCVLLSKLTSIEAGVESIRQKQLDQRDKRDLHAAFR